MTDLLWRPAGDKGGFEELDWPPLLRWGTPSLALLFLSVAVADRVGDGDVAVATVFAVTAAVPWVVQLFGRHPRPAPWVLLVIVGVSYFVFRPEAEEFSPFVMVLATGEITATYNLRLGLAAALPFAALMVAAEVIGTYNGSFIWVAAIAVGLGSGTAYQHMVRLYTELNRAQAGLAARAATDERQRIAREVHDVIAHSLAVTMLQITGARMALERGDTADAAAALGDAERIGRQSLSDVRRTVGLLTDSAAASAPPEPTAVEIADLVESYRTAGLDARMTVQGDPSRLSLAAGLGLYRIAQESLANVVKHAPGATATVELRVGDDRATLRVSNDHPRRAPLLTGGGGRGIPGIKERAQLLGGSATAGPSVSGWTVDVTIPIGDGP